MNEQTITLSPLVAASFLICVLISPVGHSCTWDRDTAEMEAKGRLDIVATIVGFFPRNPPRYYKMRLDRVLEELQSDPENLGLYDDAAVAYDRLGDPTVAIDLIERKKALLDAMPDNDFTREHRYRYLANIGTFYAHRWISNGANGADLTDLIKAEGFIAAGIELNPDAHFGREEYQLDYIRWVLKNINKSDYDENNKEFKTPYLYEKIREYSKDKTKDIKDLQLGLSGLIALGNAWESVDIFASLALALQAERHSSLAYYSYLRTKELLANGKKSIGFTDVLKDNPTSGHSNFRIRLQKEDQNYEEKRFVEMRTAAEEWQERRNQFMNKRFDQGMHPDTHPDFWDGYSYKGFKGVKGYGDWRMPLYFRDGHFYFHLPVFIIGGIIISILVFILIKIRNRRIIASWSLNNDDKQQ
jgi:tetratricopeptide (TPR) repeat protein